MPEAISPAGVAAPDDEALVSLARAGDRPACEELFKRHRGVAYRVAYRLLGNEADALDAVQDGLLKAFSALNEFDGRSAFKTWLMRVVSNAALDLGRKRGRSKVFGFGSGSGGGSGDVHKNGDLPSHSFEPGQVDDPARGLHLEDLRIAIDAALARLSPKLRVTFVLFAEAGLSYKEIALDQRIPIGTVMSRINQARQKLQSAPEIQDLETP